MGFPLWMKYKGHAKPPQAKRFRAIIINAHYGKIMYEMGYE